MTAAVKDIGRIDPHMGRFIALSPMCLVATADASGKQDVTPRGDPPGSFKVLDEHTLAIADRPGNTRLDTLRNLLENPEIALIFLLPGVNVNQAPVGARVQACVRPERVVLLPQSEYPRPNAIPATVARTIYYGDHLRLICELGHGQEQATVKRALSPSGAGASHPQPGDQVLLEFPPAATRIYAV